MATLVLSAVGSALGGAVGGSVLGLTGAVVGRAVGAAIGSNIDQRLLGAGSAPVQSGRIDAFRISSSAEGAPIARVYGSMRVGGQVIWASRFREEKSTSGGGKRSPKVTQHQYSVSLAIALCEGEIQRVGRIWADGNEIALDSVTWRLHRGTEDQTPDALIEAIEGAGNAPAYRGVAYVVFEDLQLGPFGNRLPQFNVEIIRRVRETHGAAAIDPFAELRGVALMPGTGEYSLATEKIHMNHGIGATKLANVNNASGLPDLEVSLDHLSVDLPQVNSVGLVVSWFGDDLRCGHCTVRPKVEQQEVDGVEMPWQVAGMDRAGADTISQIDGRPAFGGTPADEAVKQAIHRLNAEGKQVMFYPFILMDVPSGNALPDPWTGGVGQPVYPWRGRMTLDLAPGLAGSADKSAAAGSDVSAFFGGAAVGDFQIIDGEVVYSGPQEWSFRRFILHYAHLCLAAGGVEAFCIGSEMRSLTQIRDGLASFPAVAALVALARDVRAVLGGATKITYAADWSEYFGYQPNDGSGDVFFHLDPLWASQDVDAIGIDNYMPLSDWRDGGGHLDASAGSIYDLDYLRGNVAGGEGYDWYYANADDRDAQIPLPISDGAYGEDWVFRYKDLKSWWSNTHYNRVAGVKDTTPTEWQPQSKPFWFTEIGCAAIDKGTNQPNVFMDAKSSESEQPYYSSGTRDDYIQYRYLQAHWEHWGDPSNNPVSTEYGEPMVDMDRAHVWAWDARPWPDFPDRLNVWSDGVNYGRGHWISGRLGIATLAGVVGDLAEQAGFSDYDVSDLHGAVQGFVVNDSETVRQSLQPLMLSHAFDAHEIDGHINFKNRHGVSGLALDEEMLVHDASVPAIEFVREAAVESPEFMQVSFVEASNNYQVATASAGVPRENDAGVSKAELPVALTHGTGAAVATRWLNETAVAQDSAVIALPPSMLKTVPGDVIEVGNGGSPSLYRVDSITDAGVRRAQCVRIEASLYIPVAAPVRSAERATFEFPAPAFVQLLDLPVIRGDEDGYSPAVAVTAVPWSGAFSAWASTSGVDYQPVATIVEPTARGTLVTTLGAHTPGLWANGTGLRVKITGGELVSRSVAEVLNGANLVAIRASGSGDWEVIQFRDANLVGADMYELDGLLRGQFGTDAVAPANYPIGTEFVQLNGAPTLSDLPLSALGSEMSFRVGPASRPIDDSSYVEVRATINGTGLRPLSPVRLRALPDGQGGHSVTWVRRTRIGGDSWLGEDVPLGEEAERYAVRISHGGSELAEYKVTSPGFEYTAAMMAADQVNYPVEIAVAQISQQVGPGPFERIMIHG